MLVKIKNVADVLKYLRGRKSFDRFLEKVNVLSVEDGKCSAELKIEDEHLNTMDILDSGLSITLLDCISGYALMTKVSGSHVSVDINMRYYNRVLKGDTVLIEGYVNKMEKTMAFLEFEMRNKATGEIVVKGSHTKFIPTK